VSDEAHRVASSLLLAHLLRKAEKEKDNEEERREEKGLSRRMTAFILHERTPFLEIHRKTKGMLRRPRQQDMVERAEEWDIEEMEGMKMEGLWRRMAAFVLNEKTSPQKQREGGKERGKGGELEGKEEKEEAESDKQQAVLAYVLGERMPEMKEEC